MITREYIRNLAADMGFAACFCLPENTEDAPENIKSLVLLLKSYVPHNGLVDAFYPAKNQSYFDALKMMKRIEADCGVKAQLLSNLKLKPIATHGAGLTRGRNTINYHGEFGSKFCMELLGLEEEIFGEELPVPKTKLDCAACKRCMHACPGGAITEDGFVKEKCIRYYMMSGKAMPEHLRPYVGNGSYSVIGCDICQRVCPGNERMEKKRGEDAAFSLEELLICTPETLERFGALYGRNYANRNRIIAQAVLATANSGDMRYLPMIEALKDSPSALVREHVVWAIEKMTNLQKIY